MNATDFDFSPPRKDRIEIIPLIDVIFFLLATFVLFTLSLDKIGVIETPPPVPGPAGDDRTLYIQTSASGTLYWKEGQEASAEVVTSQELPARLAEYAKRAPAPRVLVRGDQHAKFGTAVMVMDQARLAGIKQVSIETLVSQTAK